MMTGNVIKRGGLWCLSSCLRIALKGVHLFHKRIGANIAIYGFLYFGLSTFLNCLPAYINTTGNSGVEVWWDDNLTDLKVMLHSGLSGTTFTYLVYVLNEWILSVFLLGFSIRKRDRE